MKHKLINILEVSAIWLLTYFSPIIGVLFGIGVLVVIDFITGIMAANKRGEAIRSNKMKPTITKGIVYMFAIIVAHVFEKNFSFGYDAVKVVGGLIALIELKSFDENIKDITGSSLFKKIIDRK